MALNASLAVAAAKYLGGTGVPALSVEQTEGG